MKTIACCFAFAAAITSLVSVGTLSSASPAAPAGLPNFAVVHPGLMRGAAPTPAGMASLKSMGVTTIVDLRIAPKTVAAERVQARELGMTFVNIPMGADPPTSKQVSQWLGIAAGASSTNPVYVHCQHGADRTGEMLGIYREVNDDWSWNQTYAEMRHFGFKKYYTKLAAFVKQYAKS